MMVGKHLEGKNETEVRRVGEGAKNESRAFHRETDDAHENAAETFKKFTATRNQDHDDCEQQLQADSGSDQFPVDYSAF